MRDASATPITPLERAAADSAGFTREMHREVYDRLREQAVQMWAATKQPRPTDPAVLDRFEMALYHAAQSETRDEASDDRSRTLSLYDLYMGGFPNLAWRLADYQRGLRTTEFLMQMLGRDFMTVQYCPGHEWCLFLIALGEPRRAEMEVRALLALARSRRYHAQEHSFDADLGLAEDWRNPLVYFERDSGGEYAGYAMYEAALLHTLCDSLIPQGKLSEARAVVDEMLSEDRNWESAGNWSATKPSVNPHARRALIRGLTGDVRGALADYRAADAFSLEHRKPMRVPSRDWHHRVYQIALLTRLGYLAEAQRRLDAMKVDHLRAARPWTAAEYDLATAAIAAARLKLDAARESANRALAWAAETGHKSVHLRARLILARIDLLAGDLGAAGESLRELEAGTADDQHAIEGIDAHILAGYLALASGNLARAHTLAESAASRSADLGYAWGVGDAAHLLARCAEARGDGVGALHHAGEARAARERTEDPKIAHTHALIERLAPQDNTSSE
jgi:hypothetical protein